MVLLNPGSGAASDAFSPCTGDDGTAPAPPLPPPWLVVYSVLLLVHSGPIPTVTGRFRCSGARLTASLATVTGRSGRPGF